MQKNLSATLKIKKRLFTGLQSSGQLHIGNYFGALKPFLDIYQDFDSYLMIADYHALTSLKDPKVLKQNIFDVVRDYLAVGVDPKKAVILQQSRISEHTEAAWIFDCVIPISMLELGHAYKDKVAKGLEANVGLFTYPVLMAADILLYDTDVVPVGQDQRQHVEYAREVAAKFNTAFGKTFKEPQEMIQESVAVVPGTNGKKMSKSYGNTIPLFGNKDQIAKAVMSIVTDSLSSEILLQGAHLPANVYAIHRLLHPEERLEQLYESSQGKYKVLKEALIEDLEVFIAPMRERRNLISDEEVKKVIDEGSVKAKAYASKKMEEVREKVGVTL